MSKQTAHQWAQDKRRHILCPNCENPVTCSYLGEGNRVIECLKCGLRGPKTQEICEDGLHAALGLFMKFCMPPEPEPYDPCED